MEMEKNNNRMEDPGRAADLRCTSGQTGQVQTRQYVPYGDSAGRGIEPGGRGHTSELMRTTA
jgi:hypothetical protein